MLSRCCAFVVLFLAATGAAAAGNDEKDELWRELLNLWRGDGAGDDGSPVPNAEANEYVPATVREEEEEEEEESWKERLRRGRFVAEAYSDGEEEANDSVERRGSSLAFVFDTTGSMAQELNQVKVGASKILEALRHHPDVPIHNYVLVPFGDPDIGPATTTTNHSLFKESIDNIVVVGGGDCPEMSIGAIKLALQRSLPRSYTYVFTDASAKDFWLLNDVLSLIQRKQSQVDFIMTDDCGNNSEDGYRAYERIAETSSGQIYRLNKSEVKEVLKYLKVALQPNIVNLVSQHKPAPPKDLPDEHEVLIDATLDQFTISVSGTNTSISVTDPKGKSVDGPPQLESLLHLNNVKIVNVKEPDPGPWKVLVSSDSDYRFRSTGLSGVNFHHGFSTVDTDTMKETNYRPLMGAACHLFIQISNNTKVANITDVDLVNVNGDVIQRLPLRPVPHVQGLYKTDSFIPPGDFFYLGISGYGRDGFPFRRITTTAINPQLPEKPIAKVRPRMTVPLHGSAVLRCRVESLIPLTVRWYKNGETYGDHQTCSGTCEVTLEIPRTTLTSEGSYTCVTSNSAGNSTATLLLSVRGEAPKMMGDSSVNSVVGENALLPCSVHSHLPYHADWARFTDGLHSVDEGEHLSNNSLLLRSVQSEDEGWYVCTAENREGRSQSRVYLRVRGALRVEAEPKSKTYVLGDSFVFTCNASGSPRPTLEWRKDQQSIRAEDPSLFAREEEETTLHLEFVRASREHAGTYTCHAANSGDSGTATVELIYTERPTVTTESKTVMTKDGEELVLSCAARGEPPPTMKWYKNGVEIVPDSRITVDQDGNLRLMPTRTWDVGEYSCEVSNSLGFDAEFIGLFVGTPPTFLQPPKDKSIEIGQKGTVPCSAVGMPAPEVRWTRRGGEMLNSARMSVLPGGALRISNMDVDDVGYYTCTAENAFGAASAVARIDVHGVEKPETNEVLQLPEMRGISGNDLTVPCGVTLGNPRGIVQWFKDGVLVEGSNRTEIDGNGNLILRGSQGADGGKYTCTVSNRAGNSSRTFDIVIAESPRMKNVSRNVKGQKGGEMVIPCPAEGYPPPTITWTKDGQPLPLSPTIFQDDNGSLIIRNLSEENSGTYVCIGQNSVGSTSRTVSVQVAVPPEFVDEGLHQSLNIVEGYMVILNCNNDAVPKATVHWRKNDRSLIRSRVQSEEESDTLRFVAGVDDTGIYVCTATNEVGSAQKVFNVTVLVPPRILGKKSVGSIKAKSGATLTLECKVHGVPAPTILWQRNGMYLTDNSSELTITKEGLLVVHNVTAESSGAYVCDAENAAGIMQRMYYVQVHYPPRIREESDVGSRINLKEGEEYSLPCQVEGNPKPLVLWRKNGFVIREDGNENLILLGDNTLVLLQADKDSSGTYKCEATNEEGTTSREYAIEVHTPPSLITDNYHSRKKVNEGDPVVLTCPVSDSVPPPTIRWAKDGKPLLSLLQERSDEAQLRLGDDRRQLTIAEAHPSDSGNYSCTATNSAGRADARFLVDVLMTPHFEEFNHMARRTIIAGGEVSLNCSVSGNPSPKVTWKKESEPITPDNHPGVHISMDRQHLVIPNGKVHHSGTYVCTAVNEVSRKEREFYVSVLVPPLISGPSHESLEVVAAHNLSLHCPFGGVPQPTVVWSRLGNATTALNGRSDRLEMVNVSCEDAGIYVCEATNVAGSKSKTFNVTVLEPPDIELHDVVEKLVAREGENVSLSCRAKGHPQPDITWLHNGHIIRGAGVKRGRRRAEHHVRQVELFEDGHVSLTLSNVTDECEGIYTVLASNRAGVVEKSFDLSVMSGPKLLTNHSDRFTVTAAEGFPVVLECPVRGHPRPKVSWFHLEEPVFDDPNVTLLGDELRITHSNSFHSGKYTCVAENAAGNVSAHFHVKIIEAPKLTETSAVVTAKANETIDLSCGGIADEDTRYKWLLGSAPVTNSSRVTVNGGGDKLKISNASYADSGEYTCIASNMAGYTKVSYQVGVHEAPILESPTAIDRDKNVQLHHPLSLNCPFGGRPEPKIFWYKDGRELSHLREDSRIQASGTFLVIFDVAGEDVGEYRCIAENAAGSQQLTFAVDVYVSAEWGRWSEWSNCSAACGLGQQTRARNCTADSEMDDPRVRIDRTRCTGESVDRRLCMNDCPVNGGWSGWSRWSADSATCGRIVRLRRRTCSNPKPRNNGRECEGEAVEESTVFKKCPGDAGWSDWSSWSDCSRTCDGGFKRRYRSCRLQGEICHGRSTEEKTCNNVKCRSPWQQWGEWSSCSETCGRGNRKRYRRCRLEQEHCTGENLQIEECFGSGCGEQSVPSSANFKVKGKLNGKDFERRFDVNIESIDRERLISANMDDVIDDKEKWFPYGQFLMSPLSWSTAYETDDANNGYSLTNGNYFSLSDIKFATGEDLTVKHTGDGVDSDGSLQVQIEVIGEVPLIEPHATVVIQNLEQDFVQTGSNSLYSNVQNHMDIDGEKLPFTWNSSIHYNSTRRTMPYLVEKLSTKNIRNTYDPETRNITYTSSSTISKKYEDDVCPIGFKHEPELMHCQDVDECEEPHPRCGRNERCENTFGSFLCSCSDGFARPTDDTDCYDVDECSQHANVCSHFCHNTQGSFSCSCPFGFVLSEDMKTCKALSFRGGGMIYGGGGWPRGSELRRGRNQRYESEEKEAYGSRETCPPGFYPVGPECRDRDECREEPDLCDDDEICVNTLGSHQCLSIPCPEGYHRDFSSKNCVRRCSEKFCKSLLPDTITFHSVTLTSSYPLKDILKMDVHNDDGGGINVASTKFRVTDSGGLFRVRELRRTGYLYAVRTLNKDTLYRVTVRAASFDNKSNYLYGLEFVIFIIVI